jgi:hypothetical protein
VVISLVKRVSVSTGEVPAKSPKTEHVMKKITGAQTVDEPVGIVISRGVDRETGPALLTFVWGPAEVEPAELVAA